MKRSDLDTGTVLAAVAEHGFRAWEALRATYPQKIVESAIERECRAGRLNYGVAVTRPWIEQAGADYLAAKKALKSAPEENRS